MNINIIEERKGKILLTACIGQCVHVAGVYNFINIAKKLGYNSIFLGPATPISKIINKIKKLNPDIIGLSYRLTPVTVRPLLKEFFKNYRKLNNKPERLFFAGTPEVVRIARNFTMSFE